MFVMVKKNGWVTEVRHQRLFRVNNEWQETGIPEPLLCHEGLKEWYHVPSQGPIDVVFSKRKAREAHHLDNCYGPLIWGWVVVNGKHQVACHRWLARWVQKLHWEYRFKDVWMRLEVDQ